MTCERRRAQTDMPLKKTQEVLNNNTFHRLFLLFFTFIFKRQRASGLVGQSDERCGQRASSGAGQDVQREDGEGQGETHRPGQLRRRERHHL